MSLLSDYLLKRGLNLDPLPMGETALKLSDDDLSKICAIDKEALTILLQHHINDIQIDLVQNAIPQEVEVLRQSFVEVGGVIDRYNKYKAELERRKELKDNPTKEETTTETTPPKPQTSPPVKEGEEGSL